MPTLDNFLLPTKPNLIKVAVALTGTPYLWGGKGELMFSPKGPVMSPYFGLDCSGHYTVSVHKIGGPDMRFTHNTDRMWNERPAVGLEDLQPGDLAFWGGTGPKDVDHVEMVLCTLPNGAVVTIGASGGGSKTTTLERAQAQNACVKVRPGIKHGRSDFRGFRVGYI